MKPHPQNIMEILQITKIKWKTDRYFSLYNIKINTAEQNKFS